MVERERKTRGWDGCVEMQGGNKAEDDKQLQDPTEKREKENMKRKKWK